MLLPHLLGSPYFMQECFISLVRATCPAHLILIIGYVKHAKYEAPQHTVLRRTCGGYFFLSERPLSYAMKYSLR
jgi:hypothetical protein